MTQPIFVTRAGYEALLRQKDELIAELRVSQRSKGLAAAGDSNSWHDNAEYDVHARREMALSSRIQELTRSIDSATIVDDTPRASDTVAIGHTITLRASTGEEKSYRVVGHGESDLAAQPQKLSYDAPMIAPFMERSIGYTSVIERKGERVEMTLVSIT